MILFSWTDAKTQKKRWMACQSKAEFIRLTGTTRGEMPWVSKTEDAETRILQNTGANLALGDPGRAYEARPNGGWEAVS